MFAVVVMVCLAEEPEIEPAEVTRARAQKLREEREQREHRELNRAYDDYRKEQQRGLHILLGILCGLFLLWLLTFLWFAYDVSARAPEQAPLWLIAYLIGSFLTLLFWLCARPPKRNVYRHPGT